MATSCKAPGFTRTEKRTSVLMIGTLMTPDGAHKVKIRDISSTGAHLAGFCRMPDGCDAVFERGSLFAAARVVWSKENEAGIKFYRRLSPSEIARG